VQKQETDVLWWFACILRKSFESHLFGKMVHKGMCSACGFVKIFCDKEVSVVPHSIISMCSACGFVKIFCDKEVSVVPHSIIA